MDEQTPPIDPLLDLAAEQGPAESEEPKGLATKVLRDWLIVIGVALVAALLVRVYVLQQFYISGPSMETTMFQAKTAEKWHVLLSTDPVSLVSTQLSGFQKGDWHGNFSYNGF